MKGPNTDSTLPSTAAKLESTKIQISHFSHHPLHLAMYVRYRSKIGSEQGDM